MLHRPGIDPANLPRVLFDGIKLRPFLQSPYQTVCTDISDPSTSITSSSLNNCPGVYLTPCKIRAQLHPGGNLLCRNQVRVFCQVIFKR